MGFRDSSGIIWTMCKLSAARSETSTQFCSSWCTINNVKALKASASTLPHGNFLTHTVPTVGFCATVHIPLLSSSWVWSGDDFTKSCVRSFVCLAGLALSRCWPPRRDGVADDDPPVVAAADGGRCGETDRRTSVLLPCRLSAPLSPAWDANFLNGLLAPALPVLCCCWNHNVNNNYYHLLCHTGSPHTHNSIQPHTSTYTNYILRSIKTEKKTKNELHA